MIVETVTRHCFLTARVLVLFGVWVIGASFAEESLPSNGLLVILSPSPQAAPEPFGDLDLPADNDGDVESDSINPTNNADEEESDNIDEEGSDFDDLLNLDLEQLSEASVKVDGGPLEATFTDPVVESVSKTPEKSSEAPGVVDVITAKEIEAFGAKNLYEVLERATSVFMTGSFMFRKNMASIRGNLLKHEDNHVLILLNGSPLPRCHPGWC